jgi:hypothetical protein
MSEPPNPNEPLSLEDLLAMVGADVIDSSDAEDAAEWWDNNASSDWVGALDSEPIKKPK